MKLDLKAFNTFGEFWGIVRDVNPEGAEREAKETFAILVVGDDAGLNSRLEQALTGGVALAERFVRTVDGSDAALISALPAGDLYIYALADEGVGDIAHARRVIELEAHNKPVLVVIGVKKTVGHVDGSKGGSNGGSNGPGVQINYQPSKGEVMLAARQTFVAVPWHRIAVVDYDDKRDMLTQLLPMVFSSLPKHTIALGHRLPPFRESAARALITETAKVNAEFALLSSLPSNIPVVGDVFASGADLLVLTKNQVMLMLKLAALYGRSNPSRMRTLAEIAPIVGGAFLWRTVARTLIGLMPGAISMLPKAIVAYTGTYVVGNIARYYYAFGQKPNEMALRELYVEALDEARAFLNRKATSVRESLSGGRRN